MPTPVRIVFSHCPDADTADRIATTLVTEGLAACVNITPGIRSVYRWQGTVESASEVGLAIKTVDEHVPALISRLQSLHPYELPEAIVVDASAGLPEYLAWVVSATQPSLPLT